MKKWKVTNMDKAEYIGILEFQTEQDKEWHDAKLACALIIAARHYNASAVKHGAVQKGELATRTKWVLELIEKMDNSRWSFMNLE